MWLVLVQMMVSGFLGFTCLIWVMRFIAFLLKMLHPKPYTVSVG